MSVEIGYVGDEEDGVITKTPVNGNNSDDIQYAIVNFAFAKTGRFDK